MGQSGEECEGRRQARTEILQAIREASANGGKRTPEQIAEALLNQLHAIHRKNGVR